MAVRSSVAIPLVLGALATVLSTPLDAQGEPPKYQVEARLMVWAAVSGRGSLPGQQEAISDFLVRRARVSFQGRPSESISFAFQFGQDNIGGRLLNPDGSIRIKDAYITYRADDRLQVTAGQFKIPFLRANLESGFNQLLVDRGGLPALRPAREGSRDLGAMAWGNLRALQYRLAVFDGSDQESDAAASSFRLSTRVAYNWFTRETGLGYTGTYLGTTRVLQLAAQADLQNSRLDPRDESTFANRERDYRAYALEVFFEQPLARASAVTLDAAWLHRRDDYTGPDFATRRVEGYSLQAGVLLPGQVGPGRIQLAARWEDWDAARASVTAGTSRITGGVTCYLEGHSRKVQADVTRKRETPETRNDEFRLSLSVVF